MNLDGLALSATSSSGLVESCDSKLCVRDRPFVQHNHWLPDNKQESLRGGTSFMGGLAFLIEWQGLSVPILPMTNVLGAEAGGETFGFLQVQM